MASVQVDRADQIRQGVGLLCVAAVLVLVGLLVDGQAGRVMSVAGVLMAVLAFGALAVALLRRRP